MKTLNLNLRAALVSIILFVVFIGAWQLSTVAPSVGGSSAGLTAEQIEYAKLLGKDPGVKKPLDSHNLWRWPKQAGSIYPTHFSITARTTKV